MSVIARAVLLLALSLLAVGSAVYGFAARRVNRVYDVPPPPIFRATGAEDIARGRRLFVHLCASCHAPNGANQAIGGMVAGAPPFLGDIWAPNLTSDSHAGVGDAGDGELARLLRNGIRRDRRYAAGMPRFGRLADADVAALIGFLRSADPLFAPATVQQPPTRLGIIGTLILAFGGGIDTSGAPSVAAPPPAATAAYGEYLASVVYGCVDCHTEGLGQTAEKLQSRGLLAGGYGRRNAKGEPIFATNLTPDDETGLGRWTAVELGRTLREGVARDGRTLQAPMPKFPQLDAVEVTAVFEYLRSRPAIRRPRPRGRPNLAAPPTTDAAATHSDSR